MPPQCDRRLRHGGFVRNHTTRGGAEASPLHLWELWFANCRGQIGLGPVPPRRCRPTLAFAPEAAPISVQLPSTLQAAKRFLHIGVRILPPQPGIQVPPDFSGSGQKSPPLRGLCARCGGDQTFEGLNWRLEWRNSLQVWWADFPISGNPLGASARPVRFAPRPVRDLTSNAEGAGIAQCGGGRPLFMRAAEHAPALPMHGEVHGRASRRSDRLAHSHSQSP